MKILLHGLNYAPEEIGIGKYSGEMVEDLRQRGGEVTVVTTPPYYPQWKIHTGYKSWWYTSEKKLHKSGQSNCVSVVRCPLWVPKRVSGFKRILHLASFGLSSAPVVFWKAITQRPDVIMTVEPAAFCLPTTWLAARICGAKAWLHVQDFEVDAAFELGILKQPILKKLVLAVESFLMRRFDRVSSISPNMVNKLEDKGVETSRCKLFPNWVDSDEMKPLHNPHQFRKQFLIPEDKCVAMYAGNIGAKQGLGIIADAAKAALDNNELHFVICGTGAAFPKLEESVRGLSNVQLLPPQPFEKFNELLNCADIHLLPQLRGAADLVMPSKLTGMLGTGRPVVACADTGTQIAKAVEGRGLIVAPGDSDLFHASIVELAADQSQRDRLGRAGRQYAIDHLSKKAILGQLNREIRELCSIDDQPSREEELIPSPHFASRSKDVVLGREVKER